jgi:ribosomal protein S18 acetylase RimI-like enzyme
MEVCIRKVKPEDLDAVTRVEAVCFPEAEAAPRESFRQRISTFPDSFFVAEKDGEIIGFINGCATDSRVIFDEMFADASHHREDGIYQSIFGLDVIPEYQHQGLASRLMKHLIEDAREKGRKGLTLTCKDRLIGFYERFGYKNLGLSQSVHGGAVWYDMILEFPREK